MYYSVRAIASILLIISAIPTFAEESLKGISLHTDLVVNEDSTIDVTDYMEVEQLYDGLGHINRYLPRWVCDDEGNLYTYSFTIDKVVLNGEQVLPTISDIPHEYFQVMIHTPVTGKVHDINRIEIKYKTSPVPSFYSEYGRLTWPLHGNSLSYETISASFLFPSSFKQDSVRVDGSIRGQLRNVPFVQRPLEKGIGIYISSKYPVKGDEELLANLYYPRGILIEPKDTSGWGKCGALVESSQRKLEQPEKSISIFLDKTTPVQVRTKAAWRFMQSEKDLRPWLPQVVSVLEEDNSSIRIQAISLFSNYGAGSLDLLMKAYSEYKFSHPEDFFEIVGQLGPKAEEALPLAFEALRSSNRDMVFKALISIGNIGVNKKEESAAIIFRHLLDDDFVVEGGTALGKLRAESAVPHLINLLSNPDTRHHAAGCFGLAEYDDLAPYAKEIVAKLGSRSEMYSSCVGLLVNLHSQDSIPQLLKLVISGSVYDSAMAVRGLSFFAIPETKNAVIKYMKDEFPKLLIRLEDEYAEGCATANAIGSLGPLAAPAVPALIKCLEKGSPGSRDNCAFALGAIGDKAAPAVPALIEHIGKESGTRAVETALARIGTSQAIEALKVRKKEYLLSLRFMSRVPSIRVRYPAIYTLSKLDDPIAQEEIRGLRLPKDWDSRVLSQ